MLLTSGKTSYAQQDPMYNHYMFNAMAINPGYTGLKGYPRISSLSRLQWAGFDGAPKTQYISYDMRLPKKNLGLGMNVVYDKAGPSQTTHMFANIAYHLQVAEESFLSMGIRAGLSWYKIGLADINTINDGDKQFAHNINNDMAPNFGLGFYYYTPNYYIGISTPALIENKFKAGGDGNTIVGKENRHLFIIGGYVYEITDDLIFKPSFLVRYAHGGFVSADITALVLIRDRLWCGPMWRIGTAMGAQARFKINPQVTIGYACDFATNDLAGKQFGTHEIMLTYHFNKNKFYNIKSPRYF